ncbi:MAG: C40 family peptidase [Lachnospiraceae bacterium]|nr:C40 family peptidase [Lachnospiraceae bacterium]
MKIRYLKKRMTAVALVAAMALGMLRGTTAVATRSIDEIKQDKSDLQQEISSLDSELVDLLAEINNITYEISQNEQEIDDLKYELKEAKKAEKKQYKYMKKRMKAMYENDQKSVVTMLLESGSFSDFLNKIEYANAVYEYDQQLLNTYIGVREEIKEMEVALEKEQATLQSEKNSLDSKQASLNSMISAKRSQMADFDKELDKAIELAARKAEEERLEKERKRQEALMRQQEELARRQAEQEAAEAEEDDGDDDDDFDDEDDEIIDDGTGGQDLNPSPVTGVSGSAVVAYANQFVGNPYVWGGNSLTSGCDCSGFVVQVYANFGINLSASRNSAALRYVGNAVSINNVQPGDIVCYPGHVGIYAGGGTIVEAQSSRAGITNNRSIYCHDILAIRRVV